MSTSTSSATNSNGKRFSNNMKNTVMPVAMAGSIVVLAVVGGIAWGQTKQEISSHIQNFNDFKAREGVIDRLQWEQIDNVDDVKREQAVIKERLKNLSEKQSEFRAETNSKLNTIINKLNSRN